ARPNYFGNTTKMVLLLFDSNICEGNITGVCLQADKARVGIDAWRVPSDRIGRAAPEPSRFLAIEANNIVLIFHFNFVVVPSPRGEILIVFVILLPLARARRCDFVNGSGSGEERTIGLTETPVSARFFVDLDFKSGMDCDKSGVVRRV